MNILMRSSAAAGLLLCLVCGTAGTASGQLSQPFPAAIELSSLLPANGGDGSLGFVLNGISAFDTSGFSVSSAGDFNNDGIGDMIIGAEGAVPGGNPSGECYVVFGRDTAGQGGFEPSFELSSLRAANGGDGTRGFAIRGIDAFDRCGSSVSRAGDVNGDGFDDIIIGAMFSLNAGSSKTGESYVVFGYDAASQGGTGPDLDLSSLDGSNGFIIKGASTNDHSGVSVSGAGDINGDGIDDVIIGASRASPNGFSSGGSYVVFGRDAASQGGFGPILELASLLAVNGGDGSSGFAIVGGNAGDRSGGSVSSAGDVNNDGVADIVIGSVSAATDSAVNAGQSYVVFGRVVSTQGGFAPELDLSSLDGVNGFSLSGSESGDRCGSSVSCAGDINGDGVDDLVVGASGADANGQGSGKSYVVFGRDAQTQGGFGTDLDLGSLDGGSGFVLNGIDHLDMNGISVSAAGDINGDGIDDVIVGASNASRLSPNGERSGESYVVFGRDAAGQGGFGPSMELASLNGFNGFAIRGIEEYDLSGFAVSSAGDVNADGVDDLIISAHGADGYTGESYIVFGRDVCRPDTNADGQLSPADFNAWIIAFNSQSAACDQNGDGQCLPTDFNAWIISYNAGCD